MLYLFATLALALYAFFAGAETAFVTANRLRTEMRAQRGGWAGRLARRFTQEPAALLTTCLVGSTLALVAFATLAGLALGPPLGRAWHGVLGPDAAVAGWVTLTAGLVVAVVLLVGAAFPKALLHDPSDRAVLALAPPLRLAHALLRPLVRVTGGAANALVRLAGVRTEGFEAFMRRDFELVLRESGETGDLDLDEEETEILENVLELRTLMVRDSMVPRTEIRAVAEGASLEDVRRAFIESGLARLPVYRETLDHIVGVVLAHDLFHHPPSIAAILRPVPFVPETKPSKDLLFELLRKGTTFAVVLDEFGGTAGIVTVEDLLEELFGDIRDEHDPAGALLRRLDERTFLVAGRARLDELEEAFDLALPEGDYDTVGGYLLDRIGTVPEVREAFEFDGLRFTILEATTNRIETVRIQKP